MIVMMMMMMMIIKIMMMIVPADKVFTMQLLYNTNDIILQRLRYIYMTGPYFVC